MSSGDEGVARSYIDALLGMYDKYRREDFFSLIMCGADLDNPYDGFSGICCSGVFSDFCYQSYFGDFSEDLMSYENVAEFLIDRTKSKLLAFQEFVTAISSVSKNPVFISSNGDTWVLPIIQKAHELLPSPDGFSDYQVLDLRKLYSFTTSGKKRFESPYIGSSMDQTH